MDRVLGIMILQGGRYTTKVLCSNLPPQPSFIDRIKDSLIRIINATTEKWHAYTDP
jgi:hypothetical protein